VIFQSLMRFAMLALLTLSAIGCDPLVITFGGKRSGTVSRAEAAFKSQERRQLLAMSRYPNDPAPPTELGLLYWQRGDFPAAEKHFRIALDLSQTHYLARSGIARLYLDWSKPQKAVAEALLALRDNPGDAAAFLLLARAQRAAGKIKKAAETLKGGLRLDPENVTLLLALAGHYIANGGYLASAEVLLRQAHRVAPKNPSVLSNLAIVLARQKHYRAGLKFATTAVRQRGVLASHWEVLGFMRELSVDPSGARSAYLRALRLAPDSFSVHERLALLLEKQGQKLLALEHFMAAAASSPGAIKPLRNAIRLALELKLTKQALLAARKLALAGGDDLQCQIEAARCVGACGDASNAISLWERILELKPGHLEAHRALASLQRLAGQAGRATYHFKAILEQQQSDADALEGLGALNLEEGRLKLARSFFERLVKAAPQRSGAHAMLGTLYAELGENDSAVLELKRALELDPKLASAHRELAEVLRRKREIKSASEHIAKAMELAEADPKVWVIKAKIEKSSGNSAQAALAYAKAVQVADQAGLKSGSNLLWAAAEAAEDAGSNAMAEGLYLRLAGNRTQRAGATRRLAGLSRAKGSKGAEIYWLRAALAAGGEKAAWRSRTLRKLQQLYKDTKALDAACLLYQADCQRNRDDGEAIGGLGALQFRRGMHLSAARSYERLMAAKPRSAQAARALVTIYSLLGMQRKALFAALRLVALDPKSSQARLACALAYRNSGQLRREELALRAALKLDGENPVAHNALGVLLAQSRRTAEGRGHFEQALKLRPKACWPLHNLAILNGRDLKDQEVGQFFSKKARRVEEKGALKVPEKLKNKYWVFLPAQQW
jgi:tetratricopeptide (TPR) repeat protein